MGRSATDIRVVAYLAAQASGDEKLAELVGQALGAMQPGRWFRSSGWQPTTPEEREAVRRQPAALFYEQREGEPDPPKSLPPEAVASWVERLGDRYRGLRAPGGGIELKVIDEHDRRDTLSEAEVHAARVDKWDRVWCHLAGSPMPVMGWRGHPPGTLHVFLVSDEPEAQKRWQATWEAKGPRPADVLRGRNALLLLAAAPFAMAVIEPGTPAREWRSQLDGWSGDDVARLRCELRADDGRLLWSRARPAAQRARLIAEAEAQARRTLSPRRKERIDAHPAHLACWLLKTGHGRLADIEGRTHALVAEVVLGAPAGMTRFEDDDRPEWRAVRAHVAAAQALIQARQPSIQVSQR